MKNAQYRWQHEAHRDWFVIEKKVWTYGFFETWEYVGSFVDQDPHAGRKRAERLIELEAERANKKTVTFYYGADGRQLPGFEIT